jgi:hypothetical protein
MSPCMTSPGKRLFVGPSVMAFGRVVLTGGAALGTQSQGEDQIEPSWFGAITMRVY